jgi:subtilase family serine protease
MKVKILLGLIVIAALAVLLPQMLHAKTVAKLHSKLPDLVVSTMEVKSIGAVKNGKVTILYTIKNQGKTISPATLTRISVGDQVKGVTISHPTPDLQPGGSYTGKVEYTASEGKKYFIQATADYKNNAFETNELNNGNSMYFSFGRILHQ